MYSRLVVTVKGVYITVFVYRDFINLLEKGLPGDTLQNHAFGDNFDKLRFTKTKLVLHLFCLRLFLVFAK